jgi:hypothetical protein
MDLLTVTFLALAILGAISPVRDFVTLYRYSGLRIDGYWETEWWVDGSTDHHKHKIRIKQHADRIKGVGENEWKEIFEGRVVGNHIIGTWRPGVKGVFDHGVFIMRVMTQIPPRMQGHFTGLDSAGQQFELSHTIMTLLPPEKKWTWLRWKKRKDARNSNPEKSESKKREPRASSNKVNSPARRRNKELAPDQDLR